MEQHLIHIAVLDTATSQCRERNNPKSKDKDGELERQEEERGGNEMKQSRTKMKSN